MQLGKRIKQIREARGLTQAQLADASGISQQMISKLERGASQSSGDIVEIAAALKTTAEYLRTGDDRLYAVNEHQSHYALASLAPSPTDAASPIVRTIEHLSAMLADADPSLRHEIARLVMRAIDHPEFVHRYASAIEHLLDTSE